MKWLDYLKKLIDAPKTIDKQAMEIRKLTNGLGHLERRFEKHTDVTHAEPDLRERYGYG